MEKPPSFQWYPKDCDTDENVRLMDDAEYGFYGRCLNHAWINDGLPGNLEDIGRVLGRPLSRVKRYWERVGRCFVLVDDRYRNMRQEAQRKTAREFQESRRKAANIRHGNTVHMHESEDARALHVECSPSSSASPTASAEEKRAANAAAAPAQPKQPTAIRGSRLALEDLPQEWLEWAMLDQGWDEFHAQKTWLNFRDYWISVTGEKSRKADWMATWRNWCRRERDPPASGPMLSRRERSMREEMLRD